MKFKRRDKRNGRQYAIQKCPYNWTSVERIIVNGWVVPYNQTLSRRFQCFLNIKLCISRVEGINYFFRYICKERYIVAVELRNNKLRCDEISPFQDARYVFASKATWRLFGNGYVERHPPVTRLDVHLLNLHTVYIQKVQEHSAANRQKYGSKLSEWFIANQKYPGENNLL